MTTCKEAVVSTLGSLAKVFDRTRPFRDASNGGRFWMAGNTFLVALDAMYAASVRDDYGFAVEALSFFKDNLKDTAPSGWRQDNDWWTDDYGWWGLAFAAAYTYGDVLGYSPDQKATFRQNALNCYTAMFSVWKKTTLNWSDGGNSYSITGGIANTDSDERLAGRNTVTNAIFWQVAQKLVAAGESDCAAGVSKAWDFFHQGYEQKLLFNEENLIWQRFFKMPCEGGKNDEWQPNWAWLGDQGLLMSCFYATAGDGPFTPPMAIFVANTVKAKRVVGGDILHEDLTPVPNYWMDYAAGKGTFMRNLGQVNNLLHGSGSTVADYDQWIKDNASVLWKNRDANGLFPYFWNKEQGEPSLADWGYPQGVVDCVLTAAGLSALTATLPLMADQEI